MTTDDDPAATATEGQLAAQRRAAAAGAACCQAGLLERPGAGGVLGSDGCPAPTNEAGGGNEQRAARQGTSIELTRRVVGRARRKKGTTGRSGSRSAVLKAR